MANGLRLDNICLVDGYRQDSQHGQEEKYVCPQISLNSMNNALITVLLCIFLRSSCLAQDSPTGDPNDASHFLRFQHIAPEEGLTQVRITSLLQDRQGFLWIGTLDGGLVRYDGYTFHAFKHDPYDSTSLSHSTVETLFEDSRGWLWVGTSDRLCRFHHESETFSRFALSAKSLNKPLRVTSICEDATGAILVGTVSGLYRLPHPGQPYPSDSKGPPLSTTPQTQATLLLPDVNDPGSLKNRITHLVVDKRGVIWVGTEAGLTWLTDSSGPERFTFNAFPEEPSALPPPQDRFVKNLICDRNGVVWALMGDLYGIDRVAGHWSVESYPVPDTVTFDAALFEMPKEGATSLWIGSKGLVRLDPVTRDYGRIKMTDLKDGDDISPTTIIQDTTGLVWIGFGANQIERAGENIHLRRLHAG